MGFVQAVGVRDLWFEQVAELAPADEPLDARLGEQ
jgi:hypothetical protein